MSKPKLKLFASEVTEDRVNRELDLVAGVSEPKTVAVPFGKLVPLLLDAAQNGCIWLEDFEEELIRFDSDLYDVLMAYQKLPINDAA